jgi:hypothetical protein
MKILIGIIFLLVIAGFSGFFELAGLLALLLIAGWLAKK